MISIEVPTYLLMGKRNPKKVPLNLNHYRNAHPQILNNMKKLFKETVSEDLKQYPQATVPVKITYTLHLPSRHKADIANILSIVDKYFCDALVELGVLEDDNYLFVPEITFRFGSVDKDNPRAEVKVEAYDASNNHTD